jgi:hypothetical protein
LAALPHCRLGGGSADLGLGDARANLAIREKLAADDPSHAGWQRDLIVSYAKLGGAEPGAGWWAKALEVAEAMAAKGTLAPRDAWMVKDLRRRAAKDGQ